MKKLTLGLAALLCGLTATASAAYPTGASQTGVCVPSYCGGFTFGLTGLDWRSSPQHEFGLTSTSDIDLFDLLNDQTFLSSLGTVSSHDTDDDFDWGFKANIGYIFPCSGNDINLTYTHFKSDDDRHNLDGFAVPSLAAIEFLKDPLLGPTFFLPSLVFVGTPILVLPVSEIINHPDFELTDFSSTLTSVKSDFKNHTWDLDFGQAINVGCNVNFRLFAGLRYSKLEHKFETITDTHVAGSIESIEAGSVDAIFFNDIQVGVFDDPARRFNGALTIPADITIIFNNPSSLDLDLNIHDTLIRNSRFEGLGPRIGFDLNYNFCGGFGLVGSLSTALLVGDLDNNFTQQVSSSGTVTLDDTELLFISNNQLGTEVIAPLNLNLLKEVIIDSSRPEETRVVANIDAKLGLGYTYQFCNCSRSKLTVEAGYQVSHYFNALDGLSSVDVFSSVLSNDHNAADVNFDGPYVSVQVAL